MKNTSPKPITTPSLMWYNDSLSLYIYTNTHTWKLACPPRRGHFRKGLSSKHYFSGDIILELPAPRLWACPFTPVTMRFWNWRPWPVRARKKTLLLGGRFGNDGIGQVLEWSLLTRQKSTTLKRSSGRKDVKKFEALVYISLVLSPLIWQKSHAASVCRDPSYRKFRDRNRFQSFLRKTWAELDLPPPNPIPHPPFTQRIVSWPPWQKWNSNFTKVLGFNPAPGWGLELHWSLGVWGVKLELVGAVGWVGWVCWAWVGGWWLVGFGVEAVWVMRKQQKALRDKHGW